MFASRFHLAAGLWLAFFVRLTPATAQVTPPADTLHKYQDAPAAPKPDRPWYKSKVVKATILPAVLIGYGVSTINDHGFYSSYDARADIQRAFPNFHTRVDDYLIFAPYLELGMATLLGAKSRNDRLNTLLVIVKAETVMGLVWVLKNTTDIMRPDGSTRNAFPSGHTTQAFLAASIVHEELRDHSPWFGVGAYTIATSVAALRMLNNRHWQSDVVTGAGLGILSAHVAYLTHRNRWGRKPLTRADMSVVPSLLPGRVPGFTLVWRPGMPSARTIAAMAN